MRYISSFLFLLLSNCFFLLAQDCAVVDITGNRRFGFAHKGSYYATSFVPGASYQWRISGGRITEGQGTPGVRVEWYNSGGTLSVERQGGSCPSGENTIQVEISRYIKDLDYGAFMKYTVAKQSKLYFSANNISDTRGGYLRIIRNGKTDKYQPLVNGPVNALEKNPYGGYFIAGDFDEVGGHSRTYLALLRSDGTVSDWKNTIIPSLQKLPPYTMRVDSQEIILLGFDTYNTGLKHSFRVVSAQTGNPIAWDPGISLGAQNIDQYNGEILAVDEKYIYLYIGEWGNTWLGNNDLNANSIFRIDRKTALPDTKVFSAVYYSNGIQVIDSLLFYMDREFGISMLNKNSFIQKWFQRKSFSGNYYTFADAGYICSVVQSDSTISIYKYNLNNGNILDSIIFPYKNNSTIVKGRVDNDKIYLLSRNGGIIQADFNTRKLEIPVQGGYTDAASSFVILEDGFAIGMHKPSFHPEYDKGKGIYATDYSENKPKLIASFLNDNLPTQFDLNGRYITGILGDKIFVFDTASRTFSPMQEKINQATINSINKIVHSDNIICFSTRKNMYFYHLDKDSLVMIKPGGPLKYLYDGNTTIINGKCFTTQFRDTLTGETVISFDALSGQRIDLGWDKKYLTIKSPYLAGPIGDSLILSMNQHVVISTGQLINRKNSIEDLNLSGYSENGWLTKNSRNIGLILWNFKNASPRYIVKFLQSGLDSLPVELNFDYISNVKEDLYAVSGNFIQPDGVFQPGFTYVYGPQSVMSVGQDRLSEQDLKGIDYQIGPIPANDYLQIHSDDQSIKARISDIYGNIVQPWQSETRLNVQNIPVGFYFLHIQNSRITSTIPFTITR
jgi:hypothetical protein